jgi:NADH:ubiquinone oxidoreductase subunit 6 (subunit J)
LAPTLSERGLLIIQAQHPDWQVRQLRFDLQDVRARDHTASLGTQLFTRQLIAVQAAGVLLLAALVGSLAIASRTGAQPTQAGRAR